jgi:hypothetical protein
MNHVTLSLDFDLLDQRFRSNTAPDFKRYLDMGINKLGAVNDSRKRYQAGGGEDQLEPVADLSQLDSRR